MGRSGLRVRAGWGALIATASVVATSLVPVGGKAGAEGPSTPPDAEITSAPSLTFKHRPKFEFRSNAPEATFECSLDAGPYRSCSSPHRTKRLRAGRHTFDVRALDASGAHGPPAPAHEFRVVNTQITGGPAKIGFDRKPRFRFRLQAAGDAEARFRCAVDRRGYRRCSSPLQTRRLGIGRHALRVIAVNPDAGKDPTPARHRFRINGFRRPSIKSDPIPYGDSRKRQMAAYSRRHYGSSTWRLENPKQIVLHYTVTSTYRPVWNTFASNTPALGESPGVCAQYVVDKDGTIYQLVSPSIRCRHTIGLNHRSIGIEIVQEGGGAPERAILNRRSQRVAAQRLAGWLGERYGIPISDVIGHAMANDSRYFRDRSGWRNDHSDWRSGYVREFRDGMRELRR